jgi:excinuclease ABC subunit B
MQSAIDITNKRRKIQQTYNKKHGITPVSISSSAKNSIID